MTVMLPPAMPPKNLDLGMSNKDLVAALVEAAEIGCTCQAGVQFAAWERRKKALTNEVFKRMTR